MAKQGSIKHYRQTGAAKAPSGLPFGELAVAKDGTLFVGNASNAPVPAGIQVYTHAYDAVAKRHNFTGGGGENGRALVTANVKPGDSFAVNGKAVAAYIGSDEVDELPVGRWATFVFDGTQINFKGGGSGLNFKVIAAASVAALPVNAKPNTIAVITSTEIPDWMLTRNQPTARNDGTALSGGEVWVRTTLDSYLYSFNALRKNRIDVNPVGVQQYTNGVWTAMTGYIYQNAKWNSMETLIFKNGNQYSDITGGWGGGYSYPVYGPEYWTSTGWVSGTVLLCPAPRGSMEIMVCGTQRPINLTPYSQVRFAINNVHNGGWFTIWVSTNKSTTGGKTYNLLQQSYSAPISLNVASITGDCYIFLGAHNGDTLSCTEVVLIP